MRKSIASIVSCLAICHLSSNSAQVNTAAPGRSSPESRSSGGARGEKRLNNVVSELLEVRSNPKPGKRFSFSRQEPGWIFISTMCNGNGTLKVILDQKAKEGGQA